MTSEDNVLIEQIAQKVIAEIITPLRAEVERLRKEYETAFIAGYEEAKEGYVAETGRLRAESEAFRGKLAEQCGQTLVARDKIERLLAERKNCPPASESEYVRRLETEIAQLTAEKSELADAILQTASGGDEIHFRTLVSFELAEFVFTERRKP